MGVNAETPKNGSMRSYAEYIIVFPEYESPRFQKNRPIGARIIVLNFEGGRRSRWG